MSRQSAVVFATSALAVFVLLAGFFELRPSSERPQPAPLAEAPARAQTTAAPPFAVPAPAERLLASASTPRATAPLDEPALMETLRAVRKSDPTLALQLARDGNARFKDSPDAAERAWFVVRALLDLGRRDEANAEGHALVDKYRGSRWAEDIYRHLFVNPPTHPFERGYGKQLESDP